MPNAFYDPGEARAAKVNELFTRIAPRYDLINDLQSFGLHRLWKRQVVRLAAPEPGRRALDVCCGTGDIALRLAQRGMDVLGLDFSERMLQVARQRSAVVRPSTAQPAVAPGKLEFVLGDAQHIPCPDNTFDVVTIGYGLRNLPSMEAGLREMHRVAKPGGRLIVLDFGKPPNRLWRGVYFCYLRLVVPLFGLAFCGSAQAYAYILESLRHYPAQEGVAAEMKKLGLTNVRVINFLGGVMSINYGENNP